MYKYLMTICLMLLCCNDICRTTENQAEINTIITAQAYGLCDSQ